MARASMLRRLAAALLALGLGSTVPAVALAQGVPVFQMGPATPGDIAVFARNGQIIGGAVGTMLGPSVTTVNELVLWNNATGTLIGDGRGVEVVHSDAKTAPFAENTGGAGFTVYSNQINGINAGLVWSAVNLPAAATTYNHAYDGIRSVVTANPLSELDLVSGFSSYVMNSVARTFPIPPAGGPGTAYNYIGELVNDADGAGSWGLNLLCTDNRGQVVTSNGARYCFNEIDYNFTSPNSVGVGLMFGGLSLSQPISAVALQLNRLDGYPGTGNTAKWSAFLYTNPGATRTFASINPIEPTGSFTATFAGTLMTVTAVASGVVGADPIDGAIVNATAVATGTRILSQTKPLLVGEDMGGIGRYTISAAHTLASRPVITGSNSQSVMFTGYDSSGAVTSTILQHLSTGAFVINAPTAVQIWVDTSPVGSFSTAAATIGSSLVAPVHLNTAQLTKPAVTLCGNGPVIVGTDTAGIVTMGTGDPPGCVIGFNRPYAVPPACTVTWLGTLPAFREVVAATEAALAIGQTATSSNKISYVCFGMGDG